MQSWLLFGFHEDQNELFISLLLNKQFTTRRQNGIKINDNNNNDNNKNYNKTDSF